MFFFDGHLGRLADDAGTAHVSGHVLPDLGPTSACEPGSRATRSCVPSMGGDTTAMARASTFRIRTGSNKKAKVAPIRSSSATAWYRLVPPDGRASRVGHAGTPRIRSELGLLGGVPTQYSLGCHWQEIAETQVDAAHIQAHLLEYQAQANGGSLPKDAPMPQVDSYETDGPIARVRIGQDFPTPQGAVQGRIDTDVVGPGFAATWFTGLVDTLLVGCATPTTPGSCELRYSFVVRHTGDNASTSSLGEAFIREIHERTVEDVDVWEAKAYVTKPALAHGDGPIMQYRRWCEQFYAEGVDRSAGLWTPEVTAPLASR